MTRTLARQPSVLGRTLSRHGSQLLSEWLVDMRDGVRGSDRLGNPEFDAQCSRFVEMLTQAVNISSDCRSKVFDPMRQLLDEISRGYARQGFTSTQTATFVFSIKAPLLMVIREELAGDPDAIASEIWNATELLDDLGLYATEVFCKWREDIIRRQQEEMLELSTPVLKLWNGILVVPLVGTLDSARTQIVMESLLGSILEANAQTAIIDITGVAALDTVVAQHLLKTVAAARLIGTDCIISGVRPEIAQTIVHLGIDLTAVTTKASLTGALALALQRSGFKLHRLQNRL